MVKQTIQVCENQSKEVNNSLSNSPDKPFQWGNTSELFSEIIEQNNSLNIQGYNLYKRDYLALESLLQRVAKKDMRVLELGSWKGMATAVMGGFLAKNQGTLFAIDHWQGSSSVPSMVKEAKNQSIFNIFNKNMNILGLLNKVVKPILIESTAAAEIFQDNTFDFIFIDGDHSYSRVKEDISAWLPKLKEGGIICGSCAEGYYLQYSEIVRSEIDQQCEVDYIRTEGIGVHPGVVKALGEKFGYQFEIMPSSTIWFYQKIPIDSQWSIDSSKPPKLNPDYTNQVTKLLNIFGDTIQEEPGKDNIYQSKRISLVAQYCIQEWTGNLIQFGFPEPEITKQLAELAKHFNRKLVVVTLAEAQTNNVSINSPNLELENIEQYTDFVSIIHSNFLTEEIISLIKNQEFCFAFIDGFETYNTCLNALMTVAHFSRFIGINKVLTNTEICQVFLQSSENIAHRSKLYLPFCKEAYLL